MEPVYYGQLRTRSKETIVVRKVNGKPQLGLDEPQQGAAQANGNVKVFTNRENYKALVFIWDSNDYVLTVPQEQHHFQLERIKPNSPKEDHYCFKYENSGNFTFSPLEYYIHTTTKFKRVKLERLPTGNHIMTITDDVYPDVLVTLEEPDA